MEDLVNPWQGCRVFVTRHTGFKGSWLARNGTRIRGYALAPSTQPNMFTAAKVGDVLEDARSDVHDYSSLEAAMTGFAPEIVFHLAAWPVEQIATKLASMWGDGGSWESDAAPSVHEACVLRLDTSKARAELGWRPLLGIEVALVWTMA